MVDRVMVSKDPRWLALVRQLQAIAQNGLHFTDGEFDKERYAQLRAIASQLMAMGSDGEVDQIIGLFSQDTGYTTPKVDVRGVVTRDERVLLVEERSDGCWSLPGGWADPGLSPSACVEKEIFEEAGLKAKAVRLLALFDRGSHDHPPYPFDVYKLFFHCEAPTGHPVPGLETAAAGFFSVEDLPELSQGRVTRSQIEHMLEAINHPERPVAFD